MLATRFRNGPQHPPSLYYCYGNDFKCEKGRFHSSAPGRGDLVVSSAPLSKGCKGGEAEEELGDWVLLPKDHMLIGHGDVASHRVLSVELRPIVVTQRKRAVPKETKDVAATASAAAGKETACGRGPKVMRLRSKL